MAEILHAVVARAMGDDPLEYVMSDETVDRMGDVIDQSGWNLANFRKNPIALFGHDSHFIVGHWENVRVENGALRGRLKLMDAVSDRLREIHEAVKAGILRAVSVGFRPIAEPEPLANSKRGGVRFPKSELVECSLVSIPANPNALAVAKSLHLSPETKSLIFDEPVNEDRIVARGSSGVSAASPSFIRKTPMSLARRIEGVEQEIVALKDTIAEISAKEDLEDEDLTTLEEANRQLEAKQATHDTLKRSEAALASRSEPVNGEVIPPRRPFAQPKKEAKGSDLIIRAAAVHLISEASGKGPEFAIQRLGYTDEYTGMVVKAAVSGATTTTSGWAAELVNTAMTDFLETLRPMSVYPALSAAGGGRLAFGPNQGAIKIPSRATTPSIGGSFVGEGAPIPVRRLGLTSITLSPKKMGVLSVFSREIARYSTPAIETLIRQEILADTAITLDSLLLDAVAGSSVRPAGLLNGVTALTATAGGGYAAILGDIRKLRAPFDAANASRNLVLLVNPAQQEAFSMTPGADGTLNWAQGIIARYQVVASTAIPVGRVIMVDASDFVTATGDVPEFELSNEATLHMEDTTPLQIGTAGTPNAVAAPVQSMFQTAQIAIRMLLDVSWAMRRTGMVQYVDAVTW